MVCIKISEILFTMIVRSEIRISVAKFVNKRTGICVHHNRTWRNEAVAIHAGFTQPISFANKHGKDYTSQSLTNVWSCGELQYNAIMRVLLLRSMRQHRLTHRGSASATNPPAMSTVPTISASGK